MKQTQEKLKNITETVQFYRENNITMETMLSITSPILGLAIKQ